MTIGRGIALLIIVFPVAAWADQFLHLPMTRAFPVTCRWSCPNGSGGTYYHQGIDYGTPTDSEIFASADGEVIRVKDGLRPGELVRDYQYGNHVRIHHSNGYETRYAHLLSNTITVRVGDRVEAGQLLGKSDNTGKSTGPHLHFEVRDRDGKRVNPYGDPPNYTNGCGPNALWATCPPTPAPAPDADGDGYTTAQRDCNDRDPNVHPGALELCNNVDDDCDHVVDGPWIRFDLASRIGAACTVGVGACANTGTWVCAPDGLATVCSVDPLPSSPERCNNLDDDCDDQTDEDWRAGLATDIGQPCTVDLVCGTQRNGFWACAPDGRAVVCVPVEVCNGIDDDCDGQTDNNISEELLRFDAQHCGRCFRSCQLGERCIQGNCMPGTCVDEICFTFCVATWCTDCSPQECDLLEFERCQSRCPSDLPYLPRSRSALDCLCRGDCRSFRNGSCQ